MQMGRWRGLTIAAAWLAQLGCAAMRNPTVRTSFTKDVLPRASFEMQCPKEQIEIVQLNTPLDDYTGGGAQVGAKGCGKQVVYVYGPAGWVANTAAPEPAKP